MHLGVMINFVLNVTAEVSVVECNILFFVRKLNGILFAIRNYYFWLLKINYNWKSAPSQTEILGLTLLPSI